jgi:hypothetical protein
MSPDLMRMNPLFHARPSFNGAADGESFTSSISNGTSGRSTPTFVLGGSSSTSFEVVPAEPLALSSSRAKPKIGRERGALAYSATEHQALLALLQATPTAFNGGESSPERKEHVYQKMVEGFYLDLGVVLRQSVTLYGCFVELYSTFKQAIRALSTTKGAAKCPSEFISGDPTTDMFVAQLLAAIISDSKKFQLRKWWSGEIVSMLLHLHLKYMWDFSNGKQNVSWLEGKAAEHRGEFDSDQKNCETELAQKHAVKEQEHVDAAKNRKIVAESSVKLVECMEMMTSSSDTNTDEKIGSD